LGRVTDEPGPTVRLARPADARALATVHVRTWQAAYAGIVPQVVLDGLSVARREAYWGHRLALNDDRRTWVAATNAEIVGFVTAGPARDPDLPPGAGEIHAIYVAPAAWRRGLGRRLLDTAVGELRTRGLDPIVLWVIDGNERGIGFYEHLGWRPDGARQPIDFDGTPVDEVRYRLAHA
jgi:ribosomal protein S18 acetylase RimI-like enzyme